jgi:nicotinate phosphoribosyltransferase
VGTKLGTIADRPYLDTAYKLSAYDGRPRMKLAPNKKNLVGRKQVVRTFDDQGTATGDVIAPADEVPDTGTPLLKRVMRNGARTDEAPSLDTLRSRTQENLEALPPRLHALEEVPAYPATVSEALQDRTEATADRLRAKMNT